MVYFTAGHTLREHLNAAPRIALHTALNNPYYYLKNEALKSEEGCIPNVAPDICIAYKLHLECSRLINLVDWSEAFATVVTAAEKWMQILQPQKKGMKLSMLGLLELFLN